MVNCDTIALWMNVQPGTGSSQKHKIKVVLYIIQTTNGPEPEVVNFNDLR